MQIETAIIVVAIVLAFTVFAVSLATADIYSETSVRWMQCVFARSNNFFNFKPTCDVGLLALSGHAILTSEWPLPDAPRDHSLCHKRSAERYIELLPNIDHRGGKHVDERVVVTGRRRDTQPLCTFWHSRKINMLNIDAMPLEQQIACGFAFFRIADRDGHDMRGTRHDWQARSS